MSSSQQALNRQQTESSTVPIPVSAPRTILFIVPQPFFAERGSPIRVRSTISALVELGYEVDLLALPFGQDVEIPGVHILRSWSFPGMRSVSIGPSWAKVWLDALLLIKAIQLSYRTRYFAVHGVEEGGIIAAILRMLRGTPYVFDMHSCMSEQLEHSGWVRSRFFLKAFRLLERFCMRRAAAVMTVGVNHQRLVNTVAPDVPVYPLQDLPIVSQKAESFTATVEKLRGELGIAGNQVLLYTGNFEAYQGIELLLRSFAHAHQELQRSGVESPKLLLVGGGESYDAAVCPFQALARELKISHRVHFVGQRPLAEINAYMDLADIYLSPRTAGQNTPLKIYSYMSSEKPIVATRINSHTQVLDDSCVILAEPTPDAFAEALLEAIDMSETATSKKVKLVRRSKELIETQFSPREFSRKLSEMYSHLCP